MPKPNYIQGITQIMLAMRQVVHTQDKCLPLPKFMVLKFIEEEGSVSMKTISLFLQITMPSTTSLINELVTNKLLERVADTEDRRVVQVRITPKGKQLLENQSQRITEHIQDQLSILTIRERETLFTIMQKVYKHTTAINV